MAETHPHPPTPSHSDSDPSPNHRHRQVSRTQQLVDLLALLIVPAALVGAFALPASRQSALVLEYAAPTWLTIYTAHFIHYDLIHLVTNLLSYVLLVGVGYGLAVVAGRRRFFLTTVFAILLAFPPVLSLLNLAMPRAGVFMGFSGVNMALLGLLPILLVECSRSQFWADLQPQDVGSLFLFSLSLIALLALPLSAVSVGIAGAAALGSIWYSLEVSSRNVQWRRGVDRLFSNAAAGDLLIVGSITFIGFVLLGFPSTIVDGNTIVNIYLHFLGYGLGFLGPYLLLEGGVFGEVPAVGTDAR